MTHWLVPGPVHLVLLLGLLLLHAWRPRPGARRLPGGRPLARRGSAWLRTVLAVAFGLAWVGATPAFAELVLRQLEGPWQDPAAAAAAMPADPSAVVIVLASGEMYGDDGGVEARLDIHGVERVRAGVALWRRTGGLLVLAGGPGAGPGDSLAGGMARLARDLGVPAEAMRLATGSTTTREDLESAVAAVGSATLGPSPWLVTSALHLPRAMATARALGLAPRPFPCDHRRIRQMGWRSWLPDPQAARRLQPVLHELVGLAVYRWRGWAR